MGVFYSEGDYSCIVKSQGIEQSKTGKDMIVFEFRPEAILSRDEEGNDYLDGSIRADYDRTARIVLDPTNEKMMEMNMKKLRYAGFKGATFADLDFVGKPVMFRCKYGSYNGKEVEQWEMPLPDRASQMKPLESKDRRKLDALFGKHLKEGAKPKSDPKPKQETVPADDGDDEGDEKIPF